MAILMNRLISNILFFVFAICSVNAMAGEKRWDKRTHFQHEGWERLKPKTFDYHFAGGMGNSAFGVGWQYGKRDQVSTDVLIGFLTANSADDFRFTLTVKETYIPWSIRFCDQWSFEPLGCGIYFTTVSGEDFWGQEPNKYPNKYYGLSSRMRVSIFLSQGFTFYTKNRKFPGISGFYELGTNDLYLVSRATNKYIKPKDYLRFSFGLKLMFR